MSTENVLDLDALTAEVNNLSEEELRAALVEMRTKQKVTQKKYYNPETAKKARQKAAAKMKAMVEAAKAAGIYEEIEKAASEAADAKLAEAEVAAASETEGEQN